MKLLAFGTIVNTLKRPRDTLDKLRAHGCHKKSWVLKVERNPIFFTQVVFHFDPKSYLIFGKSHVFPITT